MLAPRLPCVVLLSTRGAHAPRSSWSRRGYTLVELMLVLILILVVAVLSYPSLESMKGSFEITAATDQVRAAWALARARAVEEARPYRFAAVPQKGNYRIAPDSGEFWQGSPPVSTDNPTDKPLVVEEAVPKGVAFAIGDTTVVTGTVDDTVLPIGSIDLGQYTSVATFLPDGTSREDVRIVFSKKGVRPVVMRLRGITGAVAVRLLEDDVQVTGGRQ